MKYRSRPAMLYERRERGGWYLAFTLVCVLLAVLLLLELWVVNTVFEVQVSGSSMEHTLQNGDIIYADKRASVSHGDIVIIDVTEYRDEFSFTGEYIIKRVIATEGDSVLCRDGEVWLKYAGEEDYALLDEPYILGTTSDFSAVEIGEGEIFFLGDNRMNSTDSRILGCYRITDVVGVVCGWSVEGKGLRSSWNLLLHYFGILH